jgi:phosphoglycerate dehydrogenase-like enzyme
MKILLYGSPVAALEDGLRKRLDSNANFVTADYSDSPEILEKLLEDCQVMVTVRYNKNVPLSPSLQLIQVPGLGCDEIDFETLPAAVTLCNVGEHGPAVAEYIIGALLARATKLITQDTEFRAGSWAGSSRMGASPHGELTGARIGIVGYGAIGRALAARLHPFETKISICNRSQPENIDTDNAYFAISRLAEMAIDCDILIITVALTKETTGLIDDKVLSALPPGAVLVNVSRGPVVNEGALFAALSNGHLGGAVLDVWWNYPADVTDLYAQASKYDFTKFSDVIISPHISGWSRGTVSRRLDVIAKNIMCVMTGEVFENQVCSAS